MNEIIIIKLLKNYINITIFYFQIEYAEKN